MEAGHGTMEGSTLLQDETIAICEIVAHFAQEYRKETATEIGEESLTQVPLPVILARAAKCRNEIGWPILECGYRAQFMSLKSMLLARRASLLDKRR